MVQNKWETEGFSYEAMRKLAAYLLTQNCESQAIAVDANAYDIQSTGTKAAFINGTPYVLAADAALDVSAYVNYAAWAASTSYVTGLVSTSPSEVTHVDPDGETRHYVCISAHTSAAADEPAVGANWETYWKLLPKFATMAAGDTVADGTTKYYLVCAMADGTLSLFKAYDSSNAIQIPAFDPTRYVAVGLIAYANSAGDSAADTIGNASTCNFSTYGTFYQLTGPVFPDWDVI